jgi:hypothetical protein
LDREVYALLEQASMVSVVGLKRPTAYCRRRYDALFEHVGTLNALPSPVKPTLQLSYQLTHTLVFAFARLNAQNTLDLIAQVVCV